jgi:hypothetical protein
MVPAVHDVAPNLPVQRWPAEGVGLRMIQVRLPPCLQCATINRPQWLAVDLEIVTYDPLPFCWIRQGRIAVY